MIDDRKWTDRYRTVAKTIVEAGLSPAIAFAFWAILGVLVLFATAEGKDSPMTAFFTAFGAVGQVGLAFAVYRLGQKQFEFTKLIAERQLRIETLPFRLEVYDKWLPLFRSLMTDPSQEKLAQLIDMQNEVEKFFPENVVAAFFDLSRAYIAMFQKYQIFEMYSMGSDTKEERAAALGPYREAQTEVIALTSTAQQVMREQVRVTPQISI